jgi:hypothetical protein
MAYCILKVCSLDVISTNTPLLQYSNTPVVSYSDVSKIGSNALTADDL